MPWKDVVGLLFVVVAILVAFRGAILRQNMTTNLNATLPEESRFSGWWQWNPSQKANFKREYKQAFPEDKSDRRHSYLVMASIGLMLTAYWLIFFQ